MHLFYTRVHEWFNATSLFVFAHVCHTGVPFKLWARGPTLQKIVYEISKSFDFIEITLSSGDFTDFIEIALIVKSRKCFCIPQVLTQISLLHVPIT